MKKSEEPIIVEETFDTSIEDVWNAITVPERMRQWYFNNIASFEPKVGYETRFVVQVEERTFPHVWKVTLVVPMKRICYEWQFDGYPGRGVSDFELYKSGSRAGLRLTYTVLDDFPDDIPEFKRESGVQGWNFLIRGNLTQYLQQSQSMDD